MQQAEIIAVGSELLMGGRVDTNALFLTEGLALAGIEVRFKSVVGDEEADIVEAIRTASGRVKVIVLTGGLGPTLDDRTRQAVARATRRPLRRRAEAFEGMRRRLAVWGRTLTRAQLRQVLIPSGAEVLPNPVGSAPGFYLKWKGCVLVALPGVPSEAKQMFAVAVAPKLAREAAARGRQGRIARRMLQTFGLAESDLDLRLKGLVRAESGVRLGLLASPLGVTVSLTTCGIGLIADSKGERVLDRLVKAIRKRVGAYVYGEGDETMEEVVGRHLASGGLTLAVAESCTGGLIGHRLTQVPGSSTYLDRVAVCYSDQAKIELLGVPKHLVRRHGAVSPEVAAAMARGIRLRSHAGVGLSVTGIAGPGGGTAQKPVGLVYVGLNAGRNSQSSLIREFRFHGDRHSIKLRASQAALELLRQWLVRRGSRARS